MDSQDTPAGTGASWIHLRLGPSALQGLGCYETPPPSLASPSTPSLLYRKKLSFSREFNTTYLGGWSLKERVQHLIVASL